MAFQNINYLACWLVIVFLFGFFISLKSIIMSIIIGIALWIISETSSGGL